MKKREVTEKLKQKLDKYGDNDGEFTPVDGVIVLFKVALFILGKKK